MERRLAAILAADVVGYGRLMERDEAGTLAALKSRRAEILQPLVTKHRGRIVKLMGDGALIEFASAVNAVECAVELQTAMDSANADVPIDKRIVLRVGINLGDVMVEGSDLYGDGVNTVHAKAGGLALVEDHVLGHVAMRIINDLRRRTLASPPRQNPRTPGLLSSAYDQPGRWPIDPSGAVPSPGAPP